VRKEATSIIVVEARHSGQGGWIVVGIAGEGEIKRSTREWSGVERARVLF